MIQLKKIFILTFLLSSIIICSSYSQKRTDETTHLVVCGDNKVLIIKPAQSPQEENRTLWQWNTSDIQFQIPSKYQKLMATLDECKSVDKDSKLLLTSSSGGALLIDKETKKCLFHADVPMAHSAELLPYNKIAIALSTHPKGNSLEIYDINHPEQVLFRDTLYSGHGVVWMPQEKRLYALGFNILRSYAIKNLPNDSVSLLLDKEWTLPSNGGHDLNAIDVHELLISTHEHVYISNTQKKSFTPFKPLFNVKNVKSVNYNKATDELIYTKAETSWWTNQVYIQKKDKQSVITIDSIKVYKVRTF